MSSVLAGPRITLLALLVAGHLLADFLFQTRAGIEEKRAGSGYVRHGVVVFLVQLVVVLPLFTLPVLAAVAGIAVVHPVIDRLKTALSRRRPASLTAFFVDQGVHLLVIVAGWEMVVRGGWRPGVVGLSAGAVAGWTTAAVVAAALAFAATGGSVIVEGVLDLLDLDGGPGESRASGVPGAGRLIGILERTLVLFLVFYGQWAAAVLLLTAKSIARFEELKDRRFAEYYLVGTLASLLVAVATGLALVIVLGRAGGIG